MKRRNVFKLLGVLALAPLSVIPKPKLTTSRFVYCPYIPLIRHYGMDAEKELTKMMSEEMRHDIDLEILKRYNRSINKSYYSNIKIRLKEK